MSHKGILFLPLFGVFLIAILLSGSGISYAFHEYLPQLDTEAKLKKYFKEHMKSDTDFKNKAIGRDLKVAFTELGCGINAMSDSEYPGSEVLGNRLENCDQKMAAIKAECMLHYDIFSFCNDKTLKQYIDYRGIGGKAYDMMVSARSTGLPLLDTESATQSSQNNYTLPSTESTNEYAGSQSIDSLRQQFSNLNK